MSAYKTYNGLHLPPNLFALLTQVETERHILINCPLLQQCHDKYPMFVFTDIKELFQENDYVLLSELCDFVYEVLSIY